MPNNNPCPLLPQLIMIVCFAGLARGESNGQLDTTVISSMRGGIDPFDSPYTLHMVGEDDIQNNLVRNLPEAFKQTPGVLVQKTANGQGSLYLRGFTGYRTLALIDGIRYNNSVYRDGPNEYFSLIDVQALGRMELHQGPGSILYGSDAIGGTLNMHTKKSNYADETGAFLHGSEFLRFESAEHSQLSRTEFDLGQGGKWGLKLGYSWKKFGNVKAAKIGRQRKTGYDETGLDARLDVHLSDNWTLTLAHQNLQQDDVWRTHSTIYGVRFEGTTIGNDLRRLKDQRRSLSYAKVSGTELDGLISRATLTLSLQTSDENGDRIRANGSRILDYFDSRMLAIDLQLESDTQMGDYIYGVDFYTDHVDSGRVDSNPDGNISQVRIQGPVGDNSTYDILGFYTQGTFKPNSRTQISAGARYSRIRAKVGNYEDPATGTEASYKDSWQTMVASIRATYDLNESGEWKMWAGISQSFRAPNIADISRYGKSRSDEFEVAATDLDPERFLTYEWGIKAKTDKFEFAGTYYYTQIKDYITSTPTGNTRGALTEVSKQNSSSGYVQGVELALRYELSHGWQVYTNLTWLEGSLNTESGREPLSRMMPLTLHSGILWKAPSGKLGAELSCTIAARADKLSSGDMNDTERIPPGGTPGYPLIQLRGFYQLNESTQITLGLNNLFDEAYRSHGSGTNEPGFGISLGLKAEF